MSMILEIVRSKLSILGINEVYEEHLLLESKEILGVEDGVIQSIDRDRISKSFSCGNLQLDFLDQAQ